MRALGFSQEDAKRKVKDERWLRGWLLEVRLVFDLYIRAQCDHHYHVIDKIFMINYFSY